MIPTVEGDCRFSPGLRTTCIFVLPVVAIVQFFFVDSLLLACCIAALILFIAALGWTAHYSYEFDSDNKKFRKSVVYLMCYKRGQWYDLHPTGEYLAFQMYDHTYTFHFLNFFDTVVPEPVFTLRFVNASATFTTLLEVTDFNTLRSVLEMADSISKTYNIPFKDFVKGMAAKQRRHK